MNEHHEYLRKREPRSEANWGLIIAIVLVVAFWAWVAYGLARWLP